MKGQTLWSYQPYRPFLRERQNTRFGFCPRDTEREDIIFLCRVALNNAPNGHDSNYQIFDRIPNFRALSHANKGGDYETAGK